MSQTSSVIRVVFLPVDGPAADREVDPAWFDALPHDVHPLEVATLDGGIVVEAYPISQMDAQPNMRLRRLLSPGQPYCIGDVYLIATSAQTLTMIHLTLEQLQQHGLLV